jgi:sugar/nucleoside kinase (ribokinase family)
VADVLVVGDANPDLLLSGDVVPRWGQSEQHVEAALTLGGSGAIVAAALARLGVDVALAAAVGDDELGALTAARLGGVDLSPLQRGSQPTGLSVHLLRDGDRTILTRSGAIPALDVAAACASVAGVRHVHIASVFLIPPLAEHGGELIAAARAAGATVSVDTNFDPSGAFRAPGWLRDADAILPNGDEAMRLTGRDDVEPAARELAAEGATVAVKRGARGAVVVDGGTAYEVPAAPVERVVDSVGAGDAFDAGWIRARLDGCDAPEAAAFACACAARTLGAAGAEGLEALA